MNAPADLFIDEPPEDLFEGLDAVRALAVPPNELELEAKRPLTEAEWRRVLGRSNYRVVITAEQLAWAGKRAVRCSGCRHAGDSAHAQPWRAWCLAHRQLVSDTFLKLCREFAPR